jgi:hypothetical protein
MNQKLMARMGKSQQFSEALFFYGAFFWEVSEAIEGTIWESMP